MNSSIKQFIPPVVFNWLRTFKTSKYGWKGNYLTWREAEDEAVGYDSSEILTRIETSLDLVLSGKASFERDGVAFQEPDYNWPLVSNILKIAAENKGKLSLIDFGGSLGSAYFQNRVFLKRLESVSWSVIEQEHFVALGSKKYQNAQLRFFDSIKEAQVSQGADILLISSVLQYLEDPFSVLDNLLEYSFKTVIVDRMLFSVGAHRISVQHVPPEIYQASYACHLLDEKHFVNYFLNKGYALSFRFDTLDGEGIDYYFKGLIFEKK